MSAATTSKLQLVIRAIGAIENFLADEKILSLPEILDVRKKFDLTVPRIVVAVETFCFKPFDAGMLHLWIQEEIERSRAMHKSVPAFQNPLTDRLAKTPLTNVQIAALANGIANIIKVLRLPAAT